MSEEMTSGNNGNGHAQPGELPTVTISVDNAQLFTVRITGSFPSLDYALNMLDQARRELEAQWRLQRASLYQQQQIALAQEAQIRRDLGKRY